MANCEYCKKEFIKINPKKKYCSKACSNNYWIENRYRRQVNPTKVYGTEFFDWRDYPNGAL